jgi:hypothetical protein
VAFKKHIKLFNLNLNLLLRRFQKAYCIQPKAAAVEQPKAQQGTFFLKMPLRKPDERGPGGTGGVAAGVLAVADFAADVGTFQRREVGGTYAFFT